MIKLSRLSCIMAFALLCGVPARAQSNNALEARIKALASQGGGVIAGESISAARMIETFYQRRGYRPAWTDPRNIAELRAAVENSSEDGLQPADFHATLLQTIESLPQAEQEIVLSDALARLLYQLFYGKVDPSKVEPAWNFAAPVAGRDPVEAVGAALEGRQVAALVADVKLKHPFYLALKSGLVRFRRIAASGGWSPIAAGPKLKKGDKSPRVAAVRQRLTSTGEYAGIPAGDPEMFDAPLEVAVRAFQSNYAIETDGAVGPETLAAMNVSCERRIDQIRGSLERSRWVLRSALSSDMIIVNIAAYGLKLFFNQKKVWETRVIVGRSYTKTPIFTQRLKQIVFNPDWTVPSGIARNEILPKAKADPGYMAAHHYYLKDAGGRAIDPGAVDWSTLSASNFPYTVVQSPGDDNALGLVKFLFPNKHNVYLHDTPNRTLFQKTTRTFSHGCIRVENPLKLAELILGRKKGMSRAAIDQTVASGKLTSIPLSGDISVLLLYWTADPTAEGNVTFNQDPYGRDAVLISALNKRL